MPSDALIAIGSNIDPAVNIPKALDLLNERCPITAVSTFYRTRPIARENQPDFINGACRCTVSMRPRDLKFSVLRAIEAEIGRERTQDSHAPREIDLDIGLIGDLVLKESDLTIPDPDLETRAFLAIPFAELAPDTIVPTSGRKLSELASSFGEAELHPATDINAILHSRFSK